MWHIVLISCYLRLVWCVINISLSLICYEKTTDGLLITVVIDMVLVVNHDVKAGKHCIVGALL